MGISPDNWPDFATLTEHDIGAAAVIVLITGSSLYYVYTLVRSLVPKAKVE
jgi:hypothetical protein